MLYRLLALDVDGTLLDTRMEISPRTRAALNAVRARGIVTVIATGRARHSATDWSRRIGGGPVICCNGGMVLDEQHELLWAKAMARPVLQHTLRLTREAGLMSQCYTPTGLYMDRSGSYIRNYLAWVRKRMTLATAFRSLSGFWRTNRVHSVRNLVTWSEKPDLPPVVKVSIIGPAEALPALSARLVKEIPGVEVVSSGPDNLEVTAVGVSKGSALQALAARLKVPREAIIAVGDSGNDVEMVKYAGLGVAMGNATEDLKAVADRITTSCDQDGIPNLLEGLGLL